MLDAVLSFLWSGEMDGHTFLDNQVQGPEEFSPFDLIFETSDGYICVATVTSAQWVGFANATDNPQWLQDSRFATSEAREAHRTERLEAMQDVLRTRPTDEWIARLEGADVPCSAIHTRREVVHHPHLAASESLVVYRHPDAGRHQAGTRPREVRSNADVIRVHPPDARRAHRRGALRSRLFGTGDCGAPVGEGHRLSPLAGPAQRRRRCGPPAAPSGRARSASESARARGRRRRLRPLVRSTRNFRTVRRIRPRATPSISRTHEDGRVG